MLRPTPVRRATPLERGKRSWEKSATARRKLAAAT
jgi:hypothetical protein